MTATPLINFEDAVTAANLNANQLFAVFYADGHYANETTVRARCPKAALFAITVFGLTGKGIFAADCETGDLTVAQAVAWVEKQFALKVELICVYANLDRWLNLGLLTAIQAVEKKYGVKIKKWVADYTNVPAIPSWADAEQFATGNVDKDVALATFFQGATPVPKPTPKPAPKPVPTPKPKPAPKPKTNSGKIRAVVTVDLDNDTWTIHKLLGTGSRQIAETYRATVEVDVKPGAAAQLHIHRQT